MLGRAFLDVNAGDCEILAVSRSRPPHLDAMECAPLDVRDESAVARAFRRFCPEWIVHAAALTDVNWCETHEAEASSVNVDGSISVARAGAAVGARLLYVSTDAVFGARKGPHAEGAPTDPLNVYSRTKLEAEEGVRRLAPRTVVARVNFVGWRSDGGGLLGWGLKEMLAGRTAPGWTDVLFTPLTAPDLAHVLMEMVAKDLSGLYCVGGAEALSKAEFLEEVATCWGLDRRLVVCAEVAGEGGPARPRDTRMDSRRLQNALGHSLPGIREGLVRLRKMEPRWPAAEKGSAGKGAVN